MTTVEPTTDPITLEIIHSSLQAVSDEMFAAMRKTAMSSIIYEVLDMGTGITDGEGNLASSGAYHWMAGNSMKYAAEASTFGRMTASPGPFAQVDTLEKIMGRFGSGMPVSAEWSL